jgi:DNA-binding NarL/FixJ family response regulator
MTLARSFRPSREFALAALMLFQGACATFFVSDVTRDIFEMEATDHFISTHVSVELFVNLGLILGIVVEGFVLRQMLRVQARQEKTISAAAGAMNDLMQGYFVSWGLTPAEIDVATFTIKGFSIAEIAEMRKSAEGTVKSQLNAIYRKSGLAGRGQLVSVLIEDLLNAPLANGADMRDQS